MSLPAAPQRCIACDLIPDKSFRLSNGARLLRCPRCRLGWWDWPVFQPAELYNQNYFQSAETTAGYDDYAAQEAGLRRTARQRLNRIARVGTLSSGILEQRSLLDIGCGIGVFPEEACRLGWKASGIEVSEYAAGEARRRNLSVRCSPIEALRLEPASLDCVTLWDVIEHLVDPVATLCQIGQTLRIGGILALSTGDITSLCARLSGRRWHLFNLPEHLFFFSPRCLQLLLARAGCRIVSVIREVNWVPVAYLQERLSKMFGLGRRRAALSRGNWMVPATLFDVLGVYAVRATRTPASP